MASILKASEDMINDLAMCWLDPFLVGSHPLVCFKSQTRPTSLEHWSEHEQPLWKWSIL